MKGQLLTGITSLVCSAGAFPQYRLEFLRDTDNVELSAVRLNNLGDYIGHRHDSSGLVAVVQGVRHFVAPSNFGGSISVSDINERGIAALSTDDGRMFTWSVQSGLVELPRPTPSPSRYTIRAINDNGTIVGRRFSEDGSIALSDFTITADRQVTVHSVNFVGLDINNSDRAVGSAGTAAGFYRDLGGAEQLITGFGIESRPLVIDNGGTMYGTGYNPNQNSEGRISVLRWQTPATVEELFHGFWFGDLVSSGSGKLSASFRETQYGLNSLHIWSNESGLVSVNSLLTEDSLATGLIPVYAVDMNERGQISTFVRRPNESFGNRAAILTPVPEPGTMLALGAGLAALLRRRRTT